jgi:hypothetical protein
MLKTASVLPKMAGPTCKPTAELLGMKMLTEKYFMRWLESAGTTAMSQFTNILHKYYPRERRD